MKLHEFVKMARKNKLITIEEFYKDICAKMTAVNFERGNTDLKSSKLPLILEKLDLTIGELSEFIGPDFNSQQSANTGLYIDVLHPRLSADDNLDVLNKIEALYLEATKQRFYSFVQLNLYLIISITAHSYSKQIRPLDNSTLIELKSVYKKRKHFFAIDYKILANLCNVFPRADLHFLEKKLFPLKDDATPAIVENAHVVANNMVSYSLRLKEFKIGRKALDFQHQLLITFPSFKYLLFHAHDSMLLEYIDSKGMRPDKLSHCFFVLDLIAQSEGRGAELANKSKKNIIDLLNDIPGMTLPKFDALLNNIDTLI